jgi:hypothetical protein
VRYNHNPGRIPEMKNLIEERLTNVIKEMMTIVIKEMMTNVIEGRMTNRLSRYEKVAEADTLPTCA